MRAFVLVLLLALADAASFDWSGDYTVPMRVSHTYAMPRGCDTYWYTTILVTGNVETTRNGTFPVLSTVDWEVWTVWCQEPPCTYHFDWHLHCVEPPDALGLHAAWVLMPVAFLALGALTKCGPPEESVKLPTPRLIA